MENEINEPIQIEGQSDTPNIDLNILSDTDGLLNNIGGLLPIILIVLTVLGGIFGFNFLKNTKKMNLEQKVKSSDHKTNIKNTENLAKNLDIATKDIINNVKESDNIAKDKSLDIQESIDRTVEIVKDTNLKTQSINETKKRLREAIDKLEN